MYISILNEQSPNKSCIFVHISVSDIVNLLMLSHEDEAIHLTYVINYWCCYGSLITVVAMEV